jgi:hypothetical protein
MTGFGARPTGRLRVFAMFIGVALVAIAVLLFLDARPTRYGFLSTAFEGPITTHSFLIPITPDLNASCGPGAVYRFAGPPSEVLARMDEELIKSGYARTVGDLGWVEFTKDPQRDFDVEWMVVHKPSTSKGKATCEVFVNKRPTWTERTWNVLRYKLTPRSRPHVTR